MSVLSPTFVGFKQNSRGLKRATFSVIQLFKYAFINGICHSAIDTLWIFASSTLGIKLGDEIPKWKTKQHRINVWLWHAKFTREWLSQNCLKLLWPKLGKFTKKMLLSSKNGQSVYQSVEAGRGRPFKKIQKCRRNLLIQIRNTNTGSNGWKPETPYKQKAELRQHLKLIFNLISELKSFWD